MNKRVILLLLIILFLGLLFLYNVIITIRGEQVQVYVIANNFEIPVTKGIILSPERKLQYIYLKTKLNPTLDWNKIKEKWHLNNDFVKKGDTGKPVWKVQPDKDQIKIPFKVITWWRRGMLLRRHIYTGTIWVLFPLNYSELDSAEYIGTYPNPDQPFLKLNNRVIVTSKSADLFIDPDTNASVIRQIASGSSFTIVKLEGEFFNVCSDSGECGYALKRAFKVPQIVKKYRDFYQPSDHFYVINKETADRLVLPGISFIDMDHDIFWRKNLPLPRYVCIKPALLKKLNILHEVLKEKYPDFARIKVICGWRSPKYNQLHFGEPGNLKSLYSRHQYGDAVDLIVDSNPVDGIMDDLDGNGSVDVKDAYLLFKLTGEVTRISAIKGGRGYYSNHDIQGYRKTPYVHMDCRPYNAKWGIKNNEE